MPPISKLLQIPPHVKKWLDKSLVENSFAGYEALEFELNQRLAAANADFTVGKSSIQRYGAKFEESLQKLKLVSEQAKAVIDASPDDDAAVNQALLRMTQHKLFDVVMELDIDPDKIKVDSLARAIGSLSQADIRNKRYAAEVAKRTKAAAESVTAIAKKAGLTAQTVADIKSQILGIAG